MRPLLPFHRRASPAPQGPELPTTESPWVAPPGPALELNEVHKGFGELKVLRGVSLQVGPSETCVVFGTSGSGKTVLLKLVAGLLKPDRGEVRVFGRDLTALEGEALIEERRKVGVLFQAGALFDSMTVFENVAFPMEERRVFGKEEIARRVRHVLDQVDLGSEGDKYPSEISGGMNKRAALARALVFDPPVLVFDEPTAGLDPLTTRTVIDLIGRAGGERKRGVLAVVNDVAAAFAMADRLAMLHEGRIVAQGTPEAFRQSQHPAVQAFLRAWKRRDELARGRPS